MSTPEEPRSSVCGPCSETPQRRIQCDSRQPCQVCRQDGRDCLDGRDEQRQSAWAKVKPERIQRWAEPVQLVPGIEGGVRLQPKRDAAGRLAAFERQTLVNRNQGLRLVSSPSKARLCFPATINTENEVEEMDLLGDPVQMEADGPLLQALHDALPREPLHPAIYLNAALRDRPAHGGSSRILSSYDTTLPNLGNVAASAYFRSSDDGIVMSASVWRRAESAGGRATAVGWGAFEPTPIGARPKSRKGKERADDERGMSEDANSTLLRCDGAVLHTTTSPIQQLQLASYPHTSRLLLACRSHTSLDLLHLDATGLSSGESAIPASLSCFRYSGAQLNKRPIADCALGGVAMGYSRPGAGLVVDTEGALFGFGLDQDGSARLGRSAAWGGSQPQMYRLRKRKRKKGVGGGETSGMARVAWGGMRGADAVVAVEDEVLLYDLRSPTSEIVLLDENVLSAHSPFHESSPTKVTSLLSRSPTHPDAQSSMTMPPTAIHVVCTTRDVLWLDERMPGRDVMRWSHGRVGIEGKGSDTSLSLLELPPFEPATASAQVQRVALHSRLHPQVDIFTAELGPTCSPRTLLEPYSLPSPYRVRSAQDLPFTRAGLSFVQCGAQPSALRSPTAAAAKPSESQQDSGSEAENVTAFPSHGQDGRTAATLDTRSGPTCRMIEVGSAGQVYDRELVLASETNALEREVSEEADQVVVPDRPPESTALARPADQPIPDRKKVDATALVAVLHLTASRLDDGARDEASEVGQDQGDLVERATRMLQAMQEESDGNAGGTSLLELAVLIERDIEEDTPAGADLISMPGHAYGTSHTAGIAQQLKAPVQETSSAILDFTPQDPPTQFDALISPMTEENPQRTRIANGTLDAARIILLPRHVEPDEPTLAPNQPQPADQDPPPLHFSYLRPQDNDGDGASSDEEEAERPRGKRRPPKRKRKGPKPSLNAFGPRLLLAEWHIGADPRSYAWHSPYEGEKNKSVALDSSQAGLSRKARKKRDGTAGSFDPSSQPRSSGFPPAFQPSSSFPASSSQAYFPSLAPPSTPARPPTLQFEPRLPASSSQDWTQPAAAATQPVISITAPLDSPARAPPPFAGAASQVVPGAFGSRLSVAGHSVKDKKKGKKRVSGF